MVLSVLNSDPSPSQGEEFIARKAPRITPQTQQTLSRPQHSRWHQTSSQRPQTPTSCLDPLHFPAIFSSFDAAEAYPPPTPATRRTVVPSSCFTPEARRRRSQSRSHTPIPINVTFPQHLSDLRKQISSKVLASLGFASDVPPQYARDRMECPKVRVYLIPFNRVSITDVFFIACIKPCGRPRLHSRGRRYPRRLPSTSTTRLRRSHPHIWRPSTIQVSLVLSRGAS